HRDLKPSNILLCGGAGGKDGAVDPAGVKIADFGLARLLDSARRLTVPGTRVGTPGYMAPEQAQGRIDLIGPATDIYGLGIILYEALCGRPPFRADSEWAVIHQIVTASPPPIHNFRPDCPAGLEAICLRCLREKTRPGVPGLHQPWPGPCGGFSRASAPPANRGGA